MKKYAVIVAAGSGSRMGNAVPKQFLPLGDKPVLYYTLMAFADSFTDLHIILVLPKDHLEKGRQVVEQTGLAERIQMVTGGETRFQSVRNGIDQISRQSIVFVHDGVRCLVSKMLIKQCYNQALEMGSAIPAVPATDTIRIVEGDQHFLLDRNSVKIIQTPQTFQSQLLINAFQQPEQSTFTDEASVVEALGLPVYLIEGEYDNIKITRPIDLVIAQKIFEQRLAL